MKKSRHDPRKDSPKLKPYFGFIHSQISSGVTNSMKIFQNLQASGFKGSYCLVNNYVKRESGTQKDRAYRRVETGPGEQAQVDWGHFGKITINNLRVNIYGFVYILSYSRAIYAEFVTSQKQKVLFDCHMRAFDRLGVPRKIRYDNMKTVVTSRQKLSNGQERIFYNFDFQNFAKYYKFIPEVCPRYYPRAKGKVEAAVKYLKINFMNGEKYNKTYHSIEDLNLKLSGWLENFANKRVHATTKERPADRWEKEKQFLFLTSDYPRYQNSTFSSRMASQNSMVTYKRSAYWIPSCYARRKINIQEKIVRGATHVIFYYQNKEIISYPLSNKIGGWILPEDTSLFLSPKSVEERSHKSKMLKTSVQTRELGYYNQYVNFPWEEKK